jgi:hypothetical protein
MIDAPDVVLVGSLIMSSTVTVMLKRLDPRCRIQMVWRSSGAGSLHDRGSCGPMRWIAMLAHDEYETTH